MDKLVVGKVIMMPAMRRGLCGYAEETVLLAQETLKNMADTVHGIPVVIDHQLIDSENVERLTVGRVADMHYDQEEDVWNVHFVVDSQDAVDKLQSGWGVSTAYRITESGDGGTLNNVPYDREVKAATYDHLAIVQNPRYEMAKNPVFYNSKEEGAPNMFAKLWRLIRQEVKVNEGEELFVMVNGKEMRLNDLTTAIHEEDMKKNEKKIVLNGTDMVEYNGEKMTVEALVDKYNAMKKEEVEEKKENEEVEKKEEVEEKKENAEVEKKEEVEEKKENAEEEKKEEVKENAADDEQKKNFEEMKKIKENGISPDASQWMSLSDRLEAGRKLFGSK